MFKRMQQWFLLKIRWNKPESHYEQMIVNLKPTVHKNPPNVMLGKKQFKKNPKGIIIDVTPRKGIPIHS